MSITIYDLKEHLNITSNDDDTLLSSKIATAMVMVENFIGEKLADIEPAPAPILEAIRQLAAHLYENREPFLVGTQSAALPFNAIDLLMPYRRVVC